MGAPAHALARPEPPVPMQAAGRTLPHPKAGPKEVPVQRVRCNLPSLLSTLPPLVGFLWPTAAGTCVPPASPLLHQG